MTGQNGEPATAQKQPQTAEEQLMPTQQEQPHIPEERRMAIRQEIAEAEQLPDPTSWESYGGKRNKKPKNG